MERFSGRQKNGTCRALFSYREWLLVPVGLLTIGLAGLLASCEEGAVQAPESKAPEAIVAQQPDSDGDGVTDDKDAFPSDPGETKDSDGDKVGDNKDKFPNDAKEVADNDGDGIGDNADPDDDNDGIPDATDKDADDDGHLAMLYQGDDCDDGNKSVYPGASDPADGVDPGTDYNCDGLADADLAQGFLVDLKATEKDDTKNDGSFTKPFTGIDTALAKVEESFNAGNPRPNIYLVYYYDEKDDLSYHIAAQLLEIPPGIGIYGGYQPVKNGVRLRNPANKSIISLADKLVKIAPLGNVALPADPIVRLDSIMIGGVNKDADTFMLVTKVTVNVTRTVVTHAGATVSLSLLMTEAGSASLYMSGGSEVSCFEHKDDFTGNTVGLLAFSMNGGVVNLNLDNIKVVAGKGKDSSVGLKAFSAPNDAAVANVKLTSVTVKGGEAASSTGVMLGVDGAVGEAVIHKSYIEAGAGQTVTKKIALQANKAKALVISNSVIRGETAQSTAASSALAVNFSSVRAASNAFIGATNAASFAGSGDDLKLVNNIFSAWPKGTELFVNGKASSYTLANNLFATPPQEWVVHYQYVTPALKVKVSGVDAAPVAATNQINGVSVDGPAKTFDAGGSNIVGDPKFDKDGWHITKDSAAIGKGLPQTAFTDDIEGQPRGDIWDIGADEFVQ